MVASRVLPGELVGTILAAALYLLACSVIGPFSQGWPNVDLAFKIGKPIVLAMPHSIIHRVANLVQIAIVLLYGLARGQNDGVCAEGFEVF